MLDGVPTYALTDNEKTVTVEHVCGIAVRNATVVEVSRHYGLTIQTCEPADPQSKGGSEATVKIAKADLVSTDHNLREGAVFERDCAVVLAEHDPRALRVVFGGREAEPRYRTHVRISGGEGGRRSSLSRGG
jgi:transposase